MSYCSRPPTMNALKSNWTPFAASGFDAKAAVIEQPRKMSKKAHNEDSAPNYGDNKKAK